MACTHTIVRRLVFHSKLRTSEKMKPKDKDNVQMELVSLSVLLIVSLIDSLDWNSNEQE